MPSVRFFLLVFLSLWGFVTPAFAQEDSAPSLKAQPVAVVEKKTVPEERPPVVLELFSSQACVFCPEADRFFGELVQDEHIIGLACHVDYFDVKDGALSKPFCTDRQSWYMKTLGAGPNYTPQLVVNGHADVVGYKLEAIIEAVKREEESAPVRLTVVREEDAGVFRVFLPEQDPLPVSPLKLWLAVYDKPHHLSVAEGRNKGKAMVYYKIVSAVQDLGEWDGQEGKKIVSPGLTDQNGGFVLVAQDAEKGTIVAVADYSL